MTPEPTLFQKVQGYGLGALLAFIVLILAILFFFIGVTPDRLLVLIGLLALSRLL